jgi:hypothetical protein
MGPETLTFASACFSFGPSCDIVGCETASHERETFIMAIFLVRRLDPLALNLQLGKF